MVKDMGKSLYSLMLNEDVVREVDRMAHRLGTNRSNLINQILAEYVNYTTPEKRINDIFSAIEQLMLPTPELVPFIARNSSSMSVKSSLDYKYRPTIKYDVELYRSASGDIGEISVIYRTQSPALLREMNSFFSLWKTLEDTYLYPQTGLRHSYSLEEGRFTRSISRPDRSCGVQELAETISEYIKLFDSLMKAYIAGRCSMKDVETAYCVGISKLSIHI